MLEEQLHTISDKLTNLSTEINVSAVFWDYIRENAVALMLAWYYIVYLIQQSKRYPFLPLPFIYLVSDSVNKHLGEDRFPSRASLLLFKLFVPLYHDLKYEQRLI